MVSKSSGVAPTPTLHGQYPHIPLGTWIRELLHTEAGVQIVRGSDMNETRRFRDFFWKGRYKGLPTELLKLELEVADWAYAEQADGRGTAATLLQSEPGFALPRETRKRFREKESIRISVRGSRTELPVEIGDYLDLLPGASVDMPLGLGGDHVTVSRSDDGEVRIAGFAEYLAERGGDGEVWLEFLRDGRVLWAPRDFWLRMEGEPWNHYEDAVVRVELPSGVVEVGRAPGLGAAMGHFGFSGFTDPIGEFPLGDGDRFLILTAYDSAALDAPSNQERNEALRADIEATGATWFPAVGADREWTHQEPSFAVVGLGLTTAIALGWKYGQDAIFAWSKDYWALIDCRFGYVKSYRWEARPVDALMGGLAGEES